MLLQDFNIEPSLYIGPIKYNTSADLCARPWDDDPLFIEHKHSMLEDCNVPDAIKARILHELLIRLENKYEEAIKRISFLEEENRNINNTIHEVIQSKYFDNI